MSVATLMRIVLGFLAGSALLQVPDVQSTGPELHSDKSQKLAPLFSLVGHTDRAYVVAFSPNGKWIASASGDQTVRIWDAAAGKLLTILHATEAVFGLAFSPDSTRLATTAGRWVTDNKKKPVPGEVKVWDPATGRALLTLTGHQDIVFRVAFSPDGTKLATASKDQTAKIWNAATGKVIHSLAGSKVSFYDVAFSHDGRRLLSAGGDFFSNGKPGDARVWDVDTGQALFALGAETETIYSAVFSPNDKWIATAGRDKTVKLWDGPTGRWLRTMPGPTGQVYSVTFSRDGRFLAASGAAKSAGAGKHVWIWNVDMPTLPFGFQAHADDVHGVAFSPDSRRLVTSSNDHSVHVWDISALTDSEHAASSKRTSKELETLWNELAKPNELVAQRALWGLAATPNESLAFLHKRLRPGMADNSRIQQLIQQMDSDTFAVRERAFEELARMGSTAEPTLQAALANPPSQEVRRRIERLLNRKNQQLPESPDVQRLSLVVDLLEHVGTPDARTELGMIGRGTFGSHLGEHAKAALERLDEKR